MVSYLVGGLGMLICEKNFASHCLLLYLARIKNYIMTVGELKKKLVGIDDNKRIGGSDWFGEILEIQDVSDKTEFVALYIEDAGESLN
jgi:hypothetical protein